MSGVFISGVLYLPTFYASNHFSKQVVTVFSAPNYCDRHGNKGAICVLHGDDVSMPEFRRFEAAPHPKPEGGRNPYYNRLVIKMKLGIL